MSIYPGVTESGVSVTSIIQDKIREYMMQDCPESKIVKQDIETVDDSFDDELCVVYQNFLCRKPNSRHHAEKIISTSVINHSSSCSLPSADNNKTSVLVSTQQAGKNKIADFKNSVKSNSYNLCNLVEETNQSSLQQTANLSNDEETSSTSEDTALDSYPDSDYSAFKFRQKKKYQKNYTRKKNLFKNRAFEPKKSFSQNYSAEDNSSGGSSCSFSSGGVGNGMHVTDTAECDKPSSEDVEKISGTVSNNNNNEDGLLTNGIKSSSISLPDCTEEKVPINKNICPKNEDDFIKPENDIEEVEDENEEDEERGQEMEEKEREKCDLSDNKAFTKSVPSVLPVPNGVHEDNSNSSAVSIASDVITNGISETDGSSADAKSEQNTNLQHSNAKDALENCTNKKEADKCSNITDRKVEEIKGTEENEPMEDVQVVSNKEMCVNDVCNPVNLKLEETSKFGFQKYVQESNHDMSEMNTEDVQERKDRLKLEISGNLDNSTTAQSTVTSNSTDNTKGTEEVTAASNKTTTKIIQPEVKGRKQYDPLANNKKSVLLKKCLEEPTLDDRIVKNSTITKQSQALHEYNVKTNSSIVIGTKRRLEDVNDADGGLSSGSEGDSNSQESKRIRFDESIFEEDERERIIREFVERSADNLEGINKNCDKLQQEIAALTELARAKELEWNSIIRLLKLKEEMLERILFKKRQNQFTNGKAASIEFESNINKMYKNFISADHVKGNRSETSTPTSCTLTPVATSVLPQTQAYNSNSIANNVPLSSQSEYYKSPSSSMFASDVYSKLRPNRPILPKPATSTVSAAVVNSMILAADQQNSVIGEGRQGPILDVKSIIADFRNKNPSDTQPRRGRRLPGAPIARLDGNPMQNPRFFGNTSLLSMANMALGSGSHVRTSVSSTTHQDHPTTNAFLIGPDAVGPVAALKTTELHLRGGPSSVVASNDAIMMTSSGGVAATSSHHSFQEALVKFAKMNERRDTIPSSTSCSPISVSSAGAVQHHPQLLAQNKSSHHLPPPPPYPEVTLHPVLVPQSSASPPVQNSLLHGILTKSNNQHQHQQQHSQQINNPTSISSSPIHHRPTTFSPTLARLLTAPERSRTSRTPNNTTVRVTTKSTLSEILNSKKARTEVTITPVTTSSCNSSKPNNDVIQLDEEEEVEDRLVIDEGEDMNQNPTIPADQVPECQGCHSNTAQFVCAGCGNQWYCSRECQVLAWEDHSETCSG